tara:strand:- start:1992 stop:2162 length:171 start_codon:yes stop_codon:yes gene_type:complete
VSKVQDEYAVKLRCRYCGRVWMEAATPVCPGCGSEMHWIMIDERNELPKNKGGNEE